MQKSVLLLGAAALAATGLANIGYAQQAPANATASDQLAEIVVSASKRPEIEREVPISESVLQAEDLREQHITNVSDLARVTPNLGFTASGSVGGSGPGMGNIEIRGVSSTAGEATTAIYYDDAPMIVKNVYTVGAADPKYFDIEQLEVLRGPQGTLYGASAMGGTIRIDSKQPDSTHTNGNAYTELSQTRDGGFNYQANGVMNIAVIPDTFAVRLGVEAGGNDGWITRYALQIDDAGNPNAGALQAKHTNTDTWQVVKLAACYTPNEALSITPSVFYQHENTGDTNTASLFLGDNQIAKNTPEPGDDALALSALNVKYNLGFADLSSVTSFFYRDFRRTLDGQATNSEYLAFLTTGVTPQFNTALSNLPSPIDISNDVRQGTEEIRLASKPYDPQGSPFTWLTGLYYSEQRFTFTDNETVPGIDALFAANGYTFPANIPNTAGPGEPTATDPNFYFPNDGAFYARRAYDEKQRSVFGELGYNITPALKLIVGGRYLSATQTLAVFQDYFFGPGPATQDNAVNSHAFTPKYALTYDVTSYETLYATVSKGFRLGGANRQPPESFCGPTAPTYKPDSLWNYEVGSKGEYLDYHLMVNAAVFLINWKNIQQDLSLACSYETEINAGNARSYGGELEIRGKVSRDLTLGVQLSSTHATLTSEAGQLSLPAPAGGDVHRGDYIAGVPKYNAVINAEQHFQLTDRVSGFARVDFDIIGDSHGSLSQYEIGSTTLNPDYLRPSYHVLNARLGTQFENWDFALFGTNLLDEDKIIQHVNVEYSEEAYRLTPRTIGLSASVHF